MRAETKAAGGEVTAKAGPDAAGPRHARRPASHRWPQRHVRGAEDHGASKACNFGWRCRGIYRQTPALRPPTTMRPPQARSRTADASAHRASAAVAKPAARRRQHCGREDGIGRRATTAAATAHRDPVDHQDAAPGQSKRRLPARKARPASSRSCRRRRRRRSRHSPSTAATQAAAVPLSGLAVEIAASAQQRQEPLRDPARSRRARPHRRPHRRRPQRPGDVASDGRKAGNAVDAAPGRAATAARAERCRPEDRQWRPAVQPARPVLIRPEQRQPVQIRNAQRLIVSRGRQPCLPRSPAQLWPHARRERRRRHQGLRRATMAVDATMPTPSSRRPATNTRCELEPASTDRRTRPLAGQFPDLPDAADDAAAEPEPARSARHQPVHPAARAVRRRRAADQAERPARLAGRLQKTAQATQALAFVGKTVAVDGSTAPVRRLDGSLEPEGANGHQRDHHHHQRDRPDRLSPATIRVQPGNASFAWDGKGNDGTQWPDGNYTLTATGKDSAGNTSRSRPKSRAWSIRSISPPAPPLLSIGGQSYTIDQIKRVVRRPAAAS